MIVKEYFKTRSDGVKLFRIYSDEGRMMLQNETGNHYAVAIDVENISYTYTETDEYVGGNDATEDDYQNALRDIGVKV